MTRRNITLNRISNNILQHNAPTEAQNFMDLQINPINQSATRMVESRGIGSGLANRTNVVSQRSNYTNYQLSPSGLLGGSSLIINHNRNNPSIVHSNYQPDHVKLLNVNSSNGYNDLLVSLNRSKVIFKQSSVKGHQVPPQSAAPTIHNRRSHNYASGLQTLGKNGGSILSNTNSTAIIMSSQHFSEKQLS